jgi:menaquinol-cytochrome c reductase iron-sulfur subunit
MKRREMLTRLAQGLGVVVAGVVAVPAAIHALAPLLRRRPREVWRPLGHVADFPRGTTRRVVVELEREDWARAFDAQAVYVWHSEDEGLVVFSRRCTDLGCPVVWDPGSTWFCPCHGGIFDQSGEPRAGPQPRPLYRYRLRAVEGILEIDLASAPPAA